MLLSDYFMGTAFDAYTYFGAHPGPLGVMFRVYAPHASRVAVIGDFNNWEDHYLGKDEWGIFSDIVPYAVPGQKYKYRIYQSDGSVVDKTDPYAFGMELRPNSASYIVDMFSFKFEDEEWMKNRTRNHDSAMNIYEIHMGSWKKPGPAQEDWYNYRELAPLLIDYLKENHYTHVEVMPLAEHPFDGSWGYQQTGFYSPTARYGSADDLKFFVNELHKAGIGIIMDYVPVHFATDGYSLIRFDGTPIYEYDNENGYSEWGSCNFNFFKGEVRSFLQSAAHYWLEEYHFDGLRMDAISNVIYWAGNSNRGVNEAGLQFLKEMNAGIHSLHPTAMVIAEDSSAYAKVTAAVQYDGLGFDYKWDMGWMNDTLRYFKLAPWERCDHYHMLTFSMMYFYSELFIMTFSHDEVVHGKATIMQKMWGDYDQKFAQARLLYTYMFTHPGKKLNFMGNEIGQLREWDETREQDWFLLKYPNHDSFYHYMRELNRIYVENPALYSGDYNGENFRWLQVQGEKDCVYCYQRTCGKNIIVTAFNTQDIPHNNYSFRIPENMVLTQILNSDWNEFGGTTPHPQRRKKYRSDNNMLTIDLPPYGAVV
ncbi:MAG: 1,4-alpha-glucan branching protein GlgB, partial [Lachnospiraceae bacterium]|nr:1,4-alpha-glucan branching protein GlgB [Lachnospiraceae bacterium]